MACELDKLARRVIDGNPNSAVAKKLQDILDSGLVLFSEDTQLGDRGAGNDAAYHNYKNTIQAEYERLKGQIGQVHKTLNQTIKDVTLKDSRIVVSFNKGPDRVVKNSSLFSEEEEEDSTVFTVEADSLREGALKSVDGIKAIIEELGEVDAGYKKYVLGLLDKIDPKFVADVALYINKEADKNLGMLTDNKLVVNVAPTMDNSDKTATEVYAHELMHAITKFAIENSAKNPVAARLVNRLQYLRDEAAKVISYKDFIPKQSLDLEEDTKAAKKVYDYVFNSQNSLHEFIAHGLTNPIVMRQLSKHKLREKKETESIFTILGEWVTNLFDVIMGSIGFEQVNGTMRKNLTQLTFELMKANNNAINEVQADVELTPSTIGGLLTVGNDKLAKVIDVVMEKLEGDKYTVPKRPENATKLENAMFLVQFLPKLLMRDDLHNTRDIVLSSLGMKPEGLLQNVMRDVQEPTELERQVEALEMASSTIDRVRELTVQETRNSIRDAFSERLTEKEEEALTLSLVDVDLQSIYKDYTPSKMRKLLTDEKAIKNEIKKAKTELKKLDEANFYWHSNQATGLGYYLATHTSSLIQNLNATNIARGILSGVRRKADPKVVKLVDKIATLEGIKYTPDGSNKILADLIEKDNGGVQYVIDLTKGITKKSTSLFDTDVQMVKGYSKELFNDSVEVRIRPVKNEMEMEKEGFELVRKLKNDPLDLSGREMALYKTKYYVNNSYNRAATRMTNMVKRGTSLTDIAFSNGDLLAERAAKLEIKKIKRQSADLVAKMSSGEYKIDPDNRLSPLLNQDGKIVNYRYMMDKKTKKEMLEQDTKVGEVLGRTLGSIGDKLDTDIQNKAVLDVILADQKENYTDGDAIGRNMKEYVRVEKNSDNKDISEIYKLLPEHMKKAIRDSDAGYIAVRRDMLLNYFGFRDATVTDFMGLHNITPAVIKRWILVAEKFWADIVAISKVDIIIRTPAVFIGNVISNFMYSVVMGTNPVKVAKMQLDNMRNVTNYINMEKTIEQLRVAQLAGKNNKKVIARMEHELKKNPVHELMVAGMYQAIVEDIDKQDYKSSNKLAKKIDEVTKTLPEFVRDGTNWMYLNEHTSFFKIVTQATQYSDFVARATEYQILIAKGTDKKVAMDTILDAFINYGKPASKFEEYLNTMGLFMFTKYMKRILRTIHKTARKKPLNVLLSVLGQEAFFEVDDIWDQNLFTRGFSNLDQDMFKHIENTFTPTAFQFVGIAD